MKRANIWEKETKVIWTRCYFSMSKPNRSNYLKRQHNHDQPDRDRWNHIGLREEAKLAGRHLGL